MSCQISLWLLIDIHDQSPGEAQPIYKQSAWADVLATNILTKSECIVYNWVWASVKPHSDAMFATPMQKSETMLHAHRELALNSKWEVYRETPWPYRASEIVHVFEKDRAIHLRSHDVQNSLHPGSFFLARGEKTLVHT